ncbi:hypothetical protein KIN20_031885 [Parelaphostrongylus tenuis]|uniref:RBR-type E3 ubiquitin transferase n=1 Tax=Parelaphostrongylus tenuis TaxID=148309 RepID=A0AAD5R653_PARTN|nr:hypothetical protein KIN20_031885 [Parelaphostrongylus tenuis]
METVMQPRRELVFDDLWYNSDHDVWIEGESEESNSTNSRHRPDFEVVSESLADDIENAERIRSEVRRIYRLHTPDLNGTKSVEVSEDTSFRIWYPPNDPKPYLPRYKTRRISKKPILSAESVWKEILADPDVIYELKMRGQRLEPNIVLSPSMRRRLVHHIPRNYRMCCNGSYMVNDLDFFARAEVSTCSSDIFHKCSVFYPDMNYEKESSALCDVLMSKFSDPQPSAKLEVAIPYSPYTMEICLIIQYFFHAAIGDGGSCEILWKDRTHSLLVNVPVDQNIKVYVKCNFPRALYAVRLTTSERVKLSKHLDGSEAEIFKDAVRVYFASWTDCNDALKNKDHLVAQLFPRAFIVGDKKWNSVKNATMTYRVKWFKYPSRCIGTVILKDPRDQTLARKVLLYHGYKVRHYAIDELDTEEIVVKNIPSSFQHDTVFEEHIRRMLSQNHIAIDSAFLKRVRRGLHNIDELARIQVFQSVIQELRYKREWHGHYPGTSHDWLQLSGSNFPWQWKVLDNERSGDDERWSAAGEAELTFQDLECGLNMFNVLANNQQALFLWNGLHDSQQRIVVKPIYCVSLAITKEVRVACDKFIRNLNSEESAVAATSGDIRNSLEIVDKTWTSSYNASDDVDTSEGEISVQGWPVEHVEEVATRLLSLFQGSYIDCSDDENGRLLYGYGARYVELIRKKLRGRVVIDVDFLRERITVVGEEADLTMMKLRFFAKNSNSFIINQVIEIAPPRYPNFIWKILDSVGIEGLSEVCGNAELKRLDFVTMSFTGTLQQYDLLMDYLDEIDERLIPSICKEYISLKPKCPVCQSPVSNAYYCLECGHYYCFKCILHQIKSVTRNRLLPLCCIDKNCGKPFAISDIKRIILGDARLPWLNETKIRPLLESSIDCLLRADNSLLRCPSPDCFGIFTKKNDGPPSTATCDSCGRNVCDMCLMEPHEGFSCNVYAVLRSDHEASLRAYKDSHKEAVRDCPTEGCGAVLEKNGGCNHMHCAACDVHFCWLCGFKDGAASNVYKHLREKHGAIGNDFPLFEEDMGGMDDLNLNHLMQDALYLDDNDGDLGENM